MKHCKLKHIAKTLLGLVGFSAVVAISFLIISDAEKSYAARGAEVYVYEVYTPQYIPTPTPPPILLMPPPQATPQPRFIVHEADDYIAYQGYATSVRVQFSERVLSFHISKDIDADSAMGTIYTIIEMFDLIHESFSVLPYYNYFITAEPGNILWRQIYYNFEPTAGVITYLYFMSTSYPLPMWLSMGL
ncbi:MAG: hypothetical protein FWE42_08985, partial [Defluviitaleaceae bacterium]|nr:hypothetical protein [Defluviitaleaceae bacterium]